MARAHRQRQHGYALLLMLVTLMGIGGVVASNFTQSAREDVERQRYLHNQRVLKEAKQALLMYAYNYPAIALPNIRGPGRLPCPDTDNDGAANPTPNCVAGGNPVVGRFPWNANGINLLNPLLDADGESLWYAVSSSFDHGDDDVVNPDSFGTITIFDSNNRRLYDGSLNIPGEGIVAVIIAPGAEIDRAGVPQDRNADPLDPDNYLDLVGGRDNAGFQNSDANDGFILGPVLGPNGNIVSNDQMILVTVDEIIDMARRATLETYRDSIDAWQTAVGVNVYPWLDDYELINDLEVYHVTPADPNMDFAGRVPYMTYYMDRDSHTLITDLRITYGLEMNLQDTGPDGGNYLDAFDNALNGAQLQIQDANLSFLQENWPDTLNNITDNAATMVVDEDTVSATITGGQTVFRTLYFWDGCASCFDPNPDGWELCALPATSPGDCAMDPGSPPNFTAFSGDWINHPDIRIRFVTLRFDLDEEFELGIDTSQAIVPVAIIPPTPNPGGQSARREVDIAALVTDFDIAVEGVSLGGFGDDIVFLDVSKDNCEQDNFVGDTYNVPSSDPDSGSYDCFADLTLNAAPNAPAIQFSVEADFFPELPEWVRADGWNDSILMAYAPDHAPGGGGNCVGTAPCLTVNNEFDGVTARNVALLVGADAVPANVAALTGIFTGENDAPGEDLGAGLNTVYDANPGVAALPANGDNTLLVLEEL